ncbi:SPASM domain-containing protein [Bacteroides sp.]|uniref:SPASM domain-containing protein n=1 Tax=Bacteroides sp. TaxID=29523 RepID=UPI0026223520|nr:SPASM domain-containing protein [Bacteroides sp.]MDD3039592.1 SPASM domain-containing protein [Bacteroides sp.]
MIPTIKLLEIEIHSFCNRKCYWCPNKKIDRTCHTELNRDVYIDLLKGLKNHVETISFSRYNEPLSDLELLKDRISLARLLLPDTKLVTNTNGDYLTTLEFDIDELSIMDYDNKGVEFWIKKLSELGALVTLISHSRICAVHENMLILVELNWSTRVGIIEDRGGLLHSNKLSFKNERQERDRPCYEPMRFIGIDYTGDVTPCCHIRGDAEDHKSFILGNIYTTPISEILICKKRSSFILDCVISDFTGPCKFCQKDAGRYTKDNGGIYS